MNLPRSAFARCAAFVMLAAFAALLPQTVAAQSDPLVGKWNFVPERSTFTPGPARYKNMTMTFSGSGEMTLEGVDAQGKPVKATYSAATDGKPHPVTGMDAFDTVSWSRFSDTIATYSYLKRKSNVILGSRSLGGDGNILTFTEKTFDDKGKQTGTAVLIFAKPGFETASATPTRTPATVMVQRPGQTPDEVAGTAALGKDDADAAIAAFTRALGAKDQGGTPAYDYVMRGVAYVKKGMLEQAIADFDESLKLKPDDVDAHFRRGATRVQLKQYPGAIEDLSVVIMADENNAEAINLRAFSYSTLGQYTNSLADHEKACAMKKEYCL